MPPAPLSPYGQRFLNALQQLCREHEIALVVRGEDTLQFWDLVEAEPYGPIHCSGIDDCLTFSARRRVPRADPQC